MYFNVFHCYFGILLFNCLISMTCLKERFREGETANNSGNYPNFSIRIIDGWW